MVMNTAQNKTTTLTPQKKKELDKAVAKTVKQYRKTLELLAKT
jgi:hypothetical protein